MSDFFIALGHNIVFMTAISSMVIAQVLKAITSFHKIREFHLERLIGTGGMPSSHTALVVGLATAVNFQAGSQSPLFAVALVYAGVVMYDAAGVRRAAGKQAKVINLLVREMRVEHTLNEARLKELLGHTPLEVLAGALLGMAVAYGFHRFY
jgi:hypothetical protein